MKLTSVLLLLALCVCGCEQKPQLGDVRYDDGQLQVWEDRSIGGFGPHWYCKIDKRQLNGSFAHQDKRIDHIEERTAHLERQLACLEAGGHKYESIRKLQRGNDVDGMKPWYSFTCSSCDKQYYKMKSKLGPVEKAAMREFCDVGVQEESAEATLDRAIQPCLPGIPDYPSHE